MVVVQGWNHTLWLFERLVAAAAPTTMGQCTCDEEGQRAFLTPRPEVVKVS